MKKILFIIWSFSYGGGAERVLANLIRELATREKWDISLLEVVHSDRAWENIPDSVHVLPPLIDETKTKLSTKVGNAMKNMMFAHTPSFCRFVLRDRVSYDAVVSFNYQIPSFLLKKNELSISWNHSSIYDLYNKKKKLKAQNRAYGRANAIVSITERTEQSILSVFPHYADKSRVIYNGFDFDEIQKLANETPSIALPQNSYLSIGHLSETKDPLAVLDAFCAIKDLQPNASLFYLGRGSESESLENTIREKGLEDNVKLLGYVKNPYPLMRQAAAIISLSRLEGFQTIFVESLYLGIPFISSSAGAAELLSQGGVFGKVISAPSEAGMAAQDLCAEISSERRQQMKDYIMQFSVVEQVNQLESLIEALETEA